ncbi:hypothetical protein N2K84_06690 [Prolixibacteraceae bacterium A06]|uniref:Uncharacterized protein n=1 Tax=Gaoshiqia sediminis TaxID=2986998 RepID=A0AA41YAP0_9BACT|nr:hypothetical protein [Gaoshiqia sediminis]MCW0482410.1 hypothetical protein [Gaoshiqia sediminis]
MRPGQYHVVFGTDVIIGCSVVNGQANFVFKRRVAVGQKRFVVYKPLELDFVEHQHAFHFSEKVPFQGFMLQQQADEFGVNLKGEFNDFVFIKLAVNDQGIFLFQQFSQFVLEVLHGFRFL